MADAIFRYEVPVDGLWHTLQLFGDVLHVAARHPGAVEVWALTGGLPRTRELQVFGTGQPLPEYPLKHIGSAVVAGGALVWHLMERDR